MGRRHRHRHGKSNSLLNLLLPHNHSSLRTVRDVALGAVIASKIIKK